METQQFQKVRAVFQPSDEHINMLREEVKPFIDQEFIFQQVWTAEEGEFEGERIYLPRIDIQHDFWQWVPESDLDIIEIIY